MSHRLRLGVLASGGGSNLGAIIAASEDGRLDADVVVVISDQADAGCLERAHDRGIAVKHLSVAKTGTPEWVAANERIVEILRSHEVGLVVLAGYMRKVTPELLRAFRGAVMNIHPALLPAFPGAHGQRDAQEYGVRLAGPTVHFADEEFDRGPIIIQGVVPALQDDTPDTLAARILEVEHHIYPQAIQWFARGRLKVEGRQVLLDGAPTQAGGAALVWPPLEG